MKGLIAQCSSASSCTLICYAANCAVLNKACRSRPDGKCLNLRDDRDGWAACDCVSVQFLQEVLVSVLS